MKSLLSGEKILKLSRACEGDVFLFARTIEIEVARAFADKKLTHHDLRDHAADLEDEIE